jgi:hypothetical protein
MDESVMTPSTRTSPGAVLDLPVFKNQYSYGYITDHLFSKGFMDTQCSIGHEFQPRDSNWTSPNSINEEAVPRLVDAFLVHVHKKGPILDIKTGKEYANNAASDGLRWDAPSCLVVRLSHLYHGVFNSYNTNSYDACS